MSNDRPTIRYRKPWDRAAQDKLARAERLRKRTPFIYFIRCRSFIKIGWSTDPWNRLANMQVCNPDEITMAALICGGEREERLIHLAFKGLAHRAEWFRDEGGLSALLGSIDGLEPGQAREVVGEWYLVAFGKNSLLFDSAQKSDQDQWTTPEYIGRSVA